MVSFPRRVVRTSRLLQYTDDKGIYAANPEVSVPSMNENRAGYESEQQATSLKITDERGGAPESDLISDGGAEVADERPDRNADIKVYVDELAGTDPSRVIGYRSTMSPEQSIDRSTYADNESDVTGEAMATLIEGLKERVELTEYPDEHVLALVWLDDDHQIEYIEWDSSDLNPDTNEFV